MTNNKLIAEFMGAVGTPKYNPTEWDVYITGCLDVDSDDENAQHFYTPDEMKYHISWDWLMPVVEKIEEIAIDDTNLIVKEHRFEFDMGYTQCKIYDHNGVFEVIYGDMGSKLLSTYQAVVEFIKIYNDDEQ